MQKNLIQIAGVKNKAEIKLLCDYGVDLIGYPLHLPVNKKDISENVARDLISQTNTESISGVITYLSKADEIVEFCKNLNVKIVQLHGPICIEELVKIKRIQPDLKIIKSLVIGLLSEDEIENIIHNYYEFVDYFITDTFNSQTGASGATGLTHDWEISKGIVEVSPKPVIFAGGLNPDNVAKAIILVKPAGVDVHTGVENKNGDKDPVLVKQFITNARAGFSQLDIEINSVKVDIGDILDLHTFHPRDAKELVHDLISDCIMAGKSKIRIIHGKGRGVLRDIVHNELENDSRVASYKLANDQFSSWGATIVKLK